MRGGSLDVTGFMVRQRDSLVADVPGRGVTVLLGQNSSGKTTVLECVVTAVAGRSGPLANRARP